MPLILDDSALEGLNDKNAAAGGDTGTNDSNAASSTISLLSSTSPRFTPKYFSRELNGNGTKAAGRINAQLGPDNPDPDVTCTVSTVLRKRKTHNGDVTIHDIPISTTYAELENMFLCSTVHPFGYTINYPIYDLDKAVMLLDPRDSQGSLHNKGVWGVLTPQVIIIRQETSVDIDGKKSNDYATGVNYRMSLIVTDDYTINADDTVTLDATESTYTTSDQDLTAMSTGHYIGNRTVQGVYNTWDAKATISQELPDLLSQDHRVDEWLADYSIYDVLTNMAEHTASDDALDKLIYIMDTYLEARTHVSSTLLPNDDMAILMARQLAYLESFNLSLEAYSRLYKALNKHMAIHSSTIKMLIAQNMQLALNDNLHDLVALKPQMPVTVEDPSNPYPMPTYYSSQQRGAITSTAPLTIVSSGAGTGKSTVILERIKYIEHCGFDPAKISVLSFTNAAADNITEKNPGVRSRTFASQLAEIYAHNFPQHQQSNLSTICNSIAIHYATELSQNEPVVTNLLRLLEDVDKPGDGARLALTKLNNFIEYYQRECLEILDRVKQTSLELQIIICYQLIDQLKEPFPAPEYLIVDEVQDTSIFEFVYILRYIAKHKANLYLVGDSSQTLYEFRAANPKALNSLEASGIFSTHRLTTNYRSNQEILDFANIHLRSIEANSFAKIQLQANALSNVTAKSFQDKITIHHHQTNNLNGLAEELKGLLMTRDLRDYIEGCIARGEQVAFLANTRREATAMHETLKAMYPQNVTMSLMSDRIYSDTLFSKYIQKYWTEVTSVAPNNAPFIFTKQVLAHVHQISSGNRKYAANQLNRAKDALTNWWSANQRDIVGMIGAVNSGAMTDEEFFSHLKDNILNYEIKQNNAKQSVIGQRNRARKEQSQSDAHFFTSTIHGVKGLEFDNVVLVHRPIEDNDEADKRLYYVALTRAKNTEFIIAVGRSTMPKLVSDYRTIVAELEQAELDQAQDDADANAAAAAAANAVTSTAISTEQNNAIQSDEDSSDEDVSEEEASEEADAAGTADSVDTGEPGDAEDTADTEDATTSA